MAAATMATIICDVCRALEEEQRALLGGIEGRSGELEQSTTFHRDAVDSIKLDSSKWRHQQQQGEAQPRD